MVAKLFPIASQLRQWNVVPGCRKHLTAPVIKILDGTLVSKNIESYTYIDTKSMNWFVDLGDMPFNDTI